MRSNSASSAHSRAATSAVICCASTSSAFCGTASRSSSPRRTASSSAAHSTSSSRDSGNNRPLEVPPTECPARPTRCKKALIERVEPIWQTRSTSPMSMPELERGGGHQRLELAALQTLLGVEAALLRKAAVMRGDMLLADPLGQMARDALGQPPRIDENQRGAVLADQVRQPIVDLRPHLARHHGARAAPAAASSARSRSRDVAAVDDGAVAQASRSVPTEKSGDLLDRLLRRRQPHAHQAAAGERLQALERQRQMRAALVAGDRMNFIDDDGAAGASMSRPDCEPSSMYSDSGVVTTICGGLRRMRARSACERIAGAHHRANSTSGRPSAASSSRMPCERRFQIALNVVRQRLQRRHVNDAGLIRQHAVANPSLTS